MPSTDLMRDVESLTRQRWDVLVIGGGIHGLFAAYDAAQRGLSVALVDGADFGSGLTLNHQRTLHGGLRALQGLQLAKTRQQIRERRMWARIAPHQVRPIPFLIGTYARTKRSRIALRAGFKVYNALGRRRNASVSPELHLPRPRLESAAATRRLFPGIAAKGLTGGAIWYDYQTRHPDRLTWLVGAAAIAAGARLVNYVRADGPLTGGSGRTAGARVRDLMTDREFEIEASTTVLAVGSAAPELSSAFGAGDPPPLLRAMNVLLDRPARDIAMAAPGRSGRMLTAVPWEGFVLVGTDQSADVVAVGETAPPGSAVDAFIDDLNAAFPSLSATPEAIRVVHHGLTPATRRGGHVDLLEAPRIARSATGVISIVGVKYTTARSVAQQAIDLACEARGRSRGRCRTAETTLPHAAIADVEGRLVETQRALGLALDADIAAHLASWYGDEAPQVLREAVASHGVDRVAGDSRVLAGEIAYAVNHAGALRLSDAVLRRTALGQAGHPGRPALERVAEIMGELLGWTPERQTEEIAKVEARYPAGAWDSALGARTDVVR